MSTNTFAHTQEDIRMEQGLGLILARQQKTARSRRNNRRLTQHQVDSSTAAPTSNMVAAWCWNATNRTSVKLEDSPLSIFRVVPSKKPKLRFTHVMSYLRSEAKKQGIGTISSSSSSRRQLLGLDLSLKGLQITLLVGLSS